MPHHTTATASAPAPARACSHGTIASSAAAATQPQAPKALRTYVAAVRAAKWLRQVSAWAAMA